MKLVRSLGLSVVLAAATLGVGACGGSVEEPQTSAAATTKAPVGATTHGLVKVVGDALGEVPLRADQRSQLERLATEAETRHSAMAAGRKELALAIADQIEGGTIDRAALAPKIDRVVAEVEKARPEDRAAVAKMHALLDAEQRSAFVDALEARLSENRREHFKGFAQMKQLADDMKLTDEQRSQIRDVLRHGHGERFGRERAGELRDERAHHKGRAGGHAMKSRFHHGKQALEAFRSDRLDLDAVAPPQDLRERAAHGVTRMVTFAEKILPILTPEQRKIAADKLRERAASGDLGPFSH